MNARFVAALLLALVCGAAVAEARFCHATDYQLQGAGCPKVGSCNPVVPSTAKGCKVSILETWALRNPKCKASWSWPNPPYSCAHPFSGFISFVSLACETAYRTFEHVQPCYIKQLAPLCATRKDTVCNV